MGLEKGVGMKTVDSTWNRLSLLIRSHGLSDTDRLTMLLNVGLDALDMSVAGICRITHNDNTIYHATRREFVGKTLRLQDTLCSEVIDTQEVVAICNIQTSSWHTHPTYQTFGFESYIGLPLNVMRQPFGTFFFADYQAREKNFSQRDVAFLRLLGGSIAAVIAATMAQPLPSAST